MSSVIIFDVTGVDTEVLRNTLVTIGYFKRWIVNKTTGEKEIYTLPHNVVWKSSVELSQAKLDIQNAIDSINKENPNANAVLQRCIVLSSTPWQAIPGSPIV